MQEIGRGAKVFDAMPCAGAGYRSNLRMTYSRLMETGAEGVVALVRDAGATFLAPVYHELTGVVCTSGTPRSHIGIVSRDFQVPCVMGCASSGAEPESGTEVEVDCSGSEGRGPFVTKERVNELIAYHSEISRELTAERTSLESALIPVTAYIVVACAEAYMRYPDMMKAIDTAMPAEAIGERARRPGCQVDTCYLWSIANFVLVGRKVFGMLDPSLDTVDRMETVLDFWERAAKAYHGDGTRQAWDTGTATPYNDDVVGTLLKGATEVATPQDRTRITRFSATLVNYLFLLYFDTCAGHGDTGPYQVPGKPGRRMLVRDFYRLAQSDFSWSDVAADVPYQNLTAAFVLEGGDFRVTDFGTSNHTPEDYVERVVGFGLYTTDGCTSNELQPIDLADLDDIAAAVRKAQAAHYRNIAAMSRDEKIRSGAYVYFTFLRPFAQEAGVADELDWSVPRDLPDPVYQLLSAIEGDNSSTIEDEEYYPPLA